MFIKTTHETVIYPTSGPYDEAGWGRDLNPESVDVVESVKEGMSEVHAECAPGFKSGEVQCAVDVADS